MTLKERITSLEAQFQQQMQLREKALEDAALSARAMDQISGAIQILKELDAEQTVAEEGNGLSDPLPIDAKEGES